jgi:hypothetical protein
MSEENKVDDCLFSIEVKGDDVSIKVEGGARDIAETLTNAAIHSEEVNMVLKRAIMMLIQYERSQDEDKNEDEEDEPQTPGFGGVIGQA